MIVLPLIWVFSRACACGQLHKSATPPSKRRLLAAFALYFAAASCVIGGGAGVIASAPKIFATTRNFLNDATNIAGGISANTTTVLTAANAASTAFAASGMQVTQLNANIATLQSNANKITDKVNKNASKAYQALKQGYLGASLLGALIIFIGFSSFVGFALRSRRTLIASSWIMWLAAFLAWLLAGICYVLYIFLGDACSGITWVLGSPATSGLLGLIPCLDPAWQLQQTSNALQPIYQGYSTVNAQLASCGPNGPVGAPIAICNPVVALPGGFYGPDSTFPRGCFAPPVRALPSLTLFPGVYNTTTCPGWTNPQQFQSMGAVATTTTYMVGVIPTAELLIDCVPVFNLMNDFMFKCPAITNGGRMLSRGMIAASFGLSLGLVGLIAAYRYYFAVQEAAHIAATGGDIVDGAIKSGDADLEAVKPQDAEAPPAESS